MNDTTHRDTNLLEALVKSAQYLVRLKTQQDIWEHLGKLMTNFFPAQWVAFARRDPENNIFVHHVTPAEWGDGGKILTNEVIHLIQDVLNNGFLAARVIHLDAAPAMVAFLPIEEDYTPREVMLVGHKTSEPLENEMLNTYLAVAGLAGSAVERLHNENELNRHRDYLQDLVNERTHAMVKLQHENEERLTASLQEKEVLLKEIHHRVKNNMQVISSLANMKAEMLEDPAMRALFGGIRDQIQTMALVHEKLYLSENLAHVDFAEYARSLLTYLWKMHGAATANIKLKLELQSVYLDAKSVVPCALMLNELTVNALKHAFRGRDGGEVTVTLNSAPNDVVRLCVRDNGVAFPTGFDWRHSRSLGLQLVQMLVGQLGGTLTVLQKGGTEFQITFMPERR